MNNLVDQSLFSDLGVHIDGYIAVVAHTLVVGNKELTGKRADCMAAAFTAMEVATRLMKPGHKVLKFFIN